MDLIISIHAPRAGSDEFGTITDRDYKVFQSMLPVRGATQSYQPSASSQIFQSMLPVRGATQLWDWDDLVQNISIHAPRAGSDDCPPYGPAGQPDFNPCSPCGERREVLTKAGTWIEFQSMLPVRGATRAPPRRRPDPPRYFNPCSPCGERLPIFVPAPDTE